MKVPKQTKITAYGRHHRPRPAGRGGKTRGRARASRDVPAPADLPPATVVAGVKKPRAKPRAAATTPRINWGSPKHASRLKRAVKEWDAPAGAANSAIAAAPTMAAFAKTKATP